MSMSTEQALSYLSKGKEEPKAKEEPKVEAKETETPSVEVTKSEETNVDSPEDAKVNDGEQPKAEDKGSDEPKVDKAEDVKKKELSKQDYAFMKQKDKNRKLQEKYDKLTEQFNESNKKKDARIKELEESLKKWEGLKAEDFKKNDGSVDYDAFTQWKLNQKDMQNEVVNLRKSMTEEQQRHAIEYDRYVTERCFSGKELEDYDNLVATNGQIFAQEISKVDPNGVVFSYLESLNDYPIVLRELMTNPQRWLGQMFRSRDKDIMKLNTARVADQILAEHYNKQAEQTQPAKPAIPVIGKQIQNNNVSGPVVKDRNYWNDYLRKHPRG